MGKRAGNGMVRFISNDYKIPSGLWKELLDLCKRFKFPLKFKNFESLYLNVDKDFVTEYCSRPFGRDKKTPDTDQINSVYKSLKFRFSSLDLSVSAGKTLIMYLQAVLLKKLGYSRRTLLITIKPSLVLQIYKEFVDFRGNEEFEVGFVSGEEETDGYGDANVIISNFQTLASIAKKDPKFFHQFDAILIDEGHRITSASVRQAIINSKYHRWRCGSTGSVRKDGQEMNTAEYYNFLCFTGPTIHVLSKRDLINKGRATDGKVIVFKLNYAKEEIRRQLYMLKSQVQGTKVLENEKQMYRNSKKRTEWILKLIQKHSNLNVLVYFEDVKNGYGRKLSEETKRIVGDNVGVFYIDESVPNSTRDRFKDELELTTGNILFATWQTWSTGESVNNLHVVICAEPVKDEVLLSQAMGRLMRKHASKERFLWIDIVDDFSIYIINPNDTKELQNNILKKWQQNRVRYYESESFETVIVPIDLRMQGETF